MYPYVSTTMIITLVASIYKTLFDFGADMSSVWQTQE